MQNFLQKKGQDRPLLILRLTLLAWIIMKICSYPLWTGSRPFPLVPVHELLLQVPFYWHMVLLWGSLFCMGCFIFFPFKKLLWVILVFELLSCLLDQNRWQPWEYQFIFMLAAYLLLQAATFVFTGWQIILAGLYFFSGLAKLQPAFIHDIWNSLILRNWLGIYTNNAGVFRMGYALPLVEMFAALCLCFGRLKKTGIWLLCGMHVMVLVMFGPLGLNRNPVIWPWNLLMPLLLVLLFYLQSFLPQRSFFAKAFSWVIVACFCVLPWLQLAGRWDRYLSFTIYSGGVPHLYICTSDMAALQSMGKYMGSIRNGMIPCRAPVSTFEWGSRAMNTAPYPEKRVFKSISRQWKKQFPHAAVKFYIYTSGFSPKLEELVDF